MAYTEIWSPNKTTGSGGYKKSIIVVHTSEPGPYTPGKNPGTAAGLGNYLRNAAIEASYHTAHDRNGDRCRMVADSDRAWHAGSIANNEGYAMCAVGWSAWSRQEWLSMPKMLDDMAEQAAAWCKKDGIPPVFVSSKDLPNDVWGITGHKQTAEAWGQTDHTDPGNNFPYDVLLAKTKAILNPQPTETAIQAKRRTSPWLGAKTTAGEELATPDGIGRYTYYEHGAIYWTPETGACALSPEMVDKYKSVGYETGKLSYPTSDVFDLANEKGRAQRFKGGNVYWSQQYGAQIVLGRIGKRYAEWNWEQGFLGMPINEEYVTPDGVGREQDFQGGKIVWSQATDAHTVYGLILEKFKDGHVNRWGYPKGEENDTQDMKGRYQNYEFSTIYYKWGTPAAYGVKDEFLDIYKRMGYEVGRLGFPISDEVEVPGGAYLQEFENGYVKIDRVTKEIDIHVDGTVVKV